MKNRIADEVRAIEARQQRFAKLFSPKVMGSRAFKQEQLREYEQVLAKYGRGLNPDERFYRRLLNQQRRQMERQLYPNTVVRLARNVARLFGAAVSAPFRAAAKLSVDLDVQRKLGQAGLGEIGREVARNIRENRESFSTKLSREIAGGGKLDYSVNFVGKDNRYSLPDFRVALSDPGGIPTASVVLPREHLSLTTTKLKNLLEGRPVKVGEGKWLALDMNDRDEQGNFRSRTIESQGYDLQAQIRKIKTRGLANPKVRQEMANWLESGDQVKLKVEGKEVLLTADPRSRALSVTDGNGKKVNLNEGNTAQRNKVVKMEPSKEQANARGITR